MFHLRYLTKTRIKNFFFNFGFEKFSHASNFVNNDMHLIYSSDKDLLELMKSSLLIKENFLSESEENNLLLEIEPTMKKRRYEFDHWDNVMKKLFTDYFK